MASLRESVLAISRIPYGRPSRLTADAVLEEGRGTCSTKHLLLVSVATTTWPSTKPALFHRIYLVTKELAAAKWDHAVARLVPPGGLIDVHTFATLAINGARVPVDVTFALESWDGVSSITLACAPGVDYSAGPDPLATKAALVARHCNPELRERFIAALSAP
jgi:hypothetical protein